MLVAIDLFESGDEARPVGRSEIIVGRSADLRVAGTESSRAGRGQVGRPTAGDSAISSRGRVLLVINHLGVGGRENRRPGAEQPGEHAVRPGPT